MAETQEKIRDLHIEEELKSSYLTYAMSVIVQRALPDVRDGLKPSQRRILVAMNDLGLSPRAKYRKCAKIAGDTSGNYHPHGEAVVYPTLVRLAQDFNCRYPLVDGQGNFGSIDGDPPAAMRYTEARLTGLAMEMLEDLDRETVDFVRNYDNTRDEPMVLPSRFPNLLCNGSSGIAVGMATSLPPHNLREVAEALIRLIRNPEIGLEELMEVLPGPDFPTGGIICGTRGIRDAYCTGRGIIVIRSKAHIEETRRGSQIVVTEIPYQISKRKEIDRLVELVKTERIKGIADIRDESDREGIRLVVEVKRDHDPGVVLNQLFKHTNLQSSFSIINIALVNGRPETLPLKGLLEAFRDHRIDVIRRRTRFLLRKAEERAHIVEGYLEALDHIDRIIELIRASATVDEARARLMEAFAFTEVQATAILQMRLQRLTGLERSALEEEYGKLREAIADYRDILARESRVLDIIVGELTELAERYGDARRTEIAGEVRDIDASDLITEEKVVVTVSRDGYIKRTPLADYRSQGRGGKGIAGSSTKEGDVIRDLFIASTHDYLLLFTNRGRVYWQKVYDIPDLGRTSRGRAAVNLVALAEDELLAEQICVHDFRDDAYLVFATRRGVVKKTAVSAFANPKRTGIIALVLRPEDCLVAARVVRDDDLLLLGTRNGMALLFPSSEVRPMGRAAGGVGGIRLREGDEVGALGAPRPEDEILTVCRNGYGKRTPVSEYRRQHRNGIGVIDIRTTERNGPVVGLKAVCEEDEVVVVTSAGMVIRIPVSGIRKTGRSAQGVRLIALREGDSVVSVERVPPEEREGPGGIAAAPPEGEEPAGDEGGEAGLETGEEPEESGPYPPEELDDVGFADETSEAEDETDGFE